MKIPSLQLWAATWFSVGLMVICHVSPVMAAPKAQFRPLSTANPNVQREIRQTSVITLEGFGTSWPRVTGLDERTGIRFRNQKATADRIVRSLHSSGKPLHWDGCSSGDEIRVYFDKDKTFQTDMIWIFMRSGKAYFVPELCDWATGKHRPQQKQMFLLSPAYRKRFEALIRSIAKDAKRHHSPFKLLDFGGD